MQSDPKLVLVTGGNGYVGTHVVALLLKEGYRVRAAVRSGSAVQEMKEIHAEHADCLTTTIVPDITTAGAFDDAVKGVHGVFHLATPYNHDLKNMEVDVLIPAIKGTESILKSVQLHGTEVTRVVITSSFAAIYDPTRGLGTGHSYTETEWSPLTYEMARDGDSYTAYFGAKALAEKAAWDFVEKLPSPAKFDITVLNPPVIFGPSAKPLNFAALGISTGDINRLIDGSTKDVEPSSWPFADVRDVAVAHLRAYQRPSAGGQRFLIAGSMFSFQQVCDILRASDRIPAEEKEKITVGSPGKNYPGDHVYNVDTSKSKTMLGLQYRHLEESVVDAALVIIQNRRSQEL